MHALSFIYGKTCSVNKRGEQKSWNTQEQQWVVLLQAELTERMNEQKA